MTATVCKDSGKKATDKCTNTASEIFVEGTVPDLCDAHSNSADICNDTGLLANEYCPNVTIQYFSYIVEKERLGLWKNKSGTAKEPPTTYCTEHTLQNTTKEFKAPTITIVGETNMNLNVGDKYEEKGATAKDDIDGDLTNKIETNGNVNTSVAGKYEVTYKVKNSKGKETTVKRTINVKEKEKPKAETNTNSTNTNSDTNTNKATNTTNSSTGGNTTSTTNTTNTTKTDDKTKKDEKKEQ